MNRDTLINKKVVLGVVLFLIFTSQLVLSEPKEDTVLSVIQYTQDKIYTISESSGSVNEYKKVLRSSAKKVREIISRPGYNPLDEMTTRGQNTLHIAASKGYYTIVEEMLKNEAFLLIRNNVDKNGFTPLDLARQRFRMLATFLMPGLKDNMRAFIPFIVTQSFYFKLDPYAKTIDVLKRYHTKKSFTLKENFLQLFQYQVSKINNILKSEKALTKERKMKLIDRLEVIETRKKLIKSSRKSEKALLKDLFFMSYRELLEHSKTMRRDLKKTQSKLEGAQEKKLKAQRRNEIIKRETLKAELELENYRRIQKTKVIKKRRSSVQKTRITTKETIQKKQVIQKEEVRENPKVKEKAKVKVKESVQEKVETKGVELHGVGIYEGYTKSQGQIHGGRAHVTIDRPNKEVLLYLTAYEPVTWKLKVSKETHLQKIILAGYSQQIVKGVEKTIEIQEIDTRSGYDINTNAFRVAVKALYELTGMTFSSFQGIYSYKSRAAPFNINKVDIKSEFDIDFPKVNLSKKLPDMIFYAAYKGQPYAKFSLRGPIDPIGSDRRYVDSNCVDQVTFDPNEDVYYAIKGHSIVSRNATGDSGWHKMKVSGLSWPCGITFDTKRRRPLLASLGGQGFLYTYDILRGEWHILGSMNDVDIAAMAYDKGSDSILAIENRYRGKGVPLIIYSPDGKLRRRIKIKGDGIAMLLKDNFRSKVQLVSSGGHYAMVFPKKIYYLDLKNNQAILTWKDDH